MRLANFNPLTSIAAQVATGPNPYSPYYRTH